MIGLEDIRREVRRAETRLRSAVRRGLLSFVSASYFVQVEAGEGEVYDDVELWQQFGLASLPPAGGEALLAKVDGAGEGAVAFATTDRAHRPTGLSSGDAMLYALTASGGGQARVKTGADGVVTLTPGTGKTVGIGAATQGMALGGELAARLLALGVALSVLAPAAGPDAATINGIITALATFTSTPTGVVSTVGRLE